jgi:hypothetical protein
MDPDGLGDHGLDGMGSGEPDPGLDDRAQTDPGWPDDVPNHDDHFGDHLDPDRERDRRQAHGDTAEQADLGFAEDYGHPYQLGGEHPVDNGDLEEPAVAGPDVRTPIGYGDLSPDPTHELADLHDLAGAGDASFGADPDLPPLDDADLGQHPPFPPPLDLDAPEPIDGYPWTDPTVLGHDTLPPLDAASSGPDPDELFEYAGEQPPAGGDAWSALLASADPATSTLARWWSPG